MFWVEIWKKYVRIFIIWKFYFFVVKLSIYLNRHVFVMTGRICPTACSLTLRIILSFGVTRAWKSKCTTTSESASETIRIKCQIVLSLKIRYCLLLFTVSRIIVSLSNSAPLECACAKLGSALFQWAKEIMNYFWVFMYNNSIMFIHRNPSIIRRSAPTPPHPHQPTTTHNLPLI